MNLRSLRAPLTVCLVLAAACASSIDTGGDAAGTSARSAPLALDLPISSAPFDSLQTNWKHRLDQPYVFVEALGSYTHVGRSLAAAFDAARAQGLEIVGPPFALYYDDPGRKPASELRLRACLPVEAGARVSGPLGYDVLPSTTVVYAYVAGPYPEAPRAYPQLYAYLRQMNWVEAGPVREVYLINPADVRDWSELVCEIQVPASLVR